MIPDRNELILRILTKLRKHDKSLFTQMELNLLLDLLEETYKFSPQ